MRPQEYRADIDGLAVMFYHAHFWLPHHEAPFERTPAQGPHFLF